MATNNITQGAVANRNGKIVEQMLLPIFQQCGFSVFTEQETLKKPTILNGLNRYVLTNVGYTSIYNSNRSKTEYVIVDNTQNRKVRVEVKYQVSAGSVDEKYPYMLLNGIYAYPENEVVFLVDGGGYKPGARKWLEDKIKNNWLNYQGMGKDIKLMDLSDFVKYFTQTFG